MNRDERYLVSWLKVTVHIFGWLWVLLLLYCLLSVMLYYFFPESNTLCL